MKQKEKFLESEGNGWLLRNQNAIKKRRFPEDDPVLRELVTLPFDSGGDKVSLLEIGCRSGYKLEWIQKNLGYECKGIEPSKKAVEEAKQKGLNVIQGTADELPFSDNSFDIVIFGFCLYLCDREDLFRIACEADRVLKTQGWIIIYDFYSPSPVKTPYHHVPGMFSYKMDYKKMFTWHPSYTCFKHVVSHHEYPSKTCFSDDKSQWMAITILRKCEQ